MATSATITATMNAGSHNIYVLAVTGDGSTKTIQTTFRTVVAAWDGGTVDNTTAIGGITITEATSTADVILTTDNAIDSADVHYICIAGY